MSECKHEWSKSKMFYGKSDCPYCEINRLKAELGEGQQERDNLRSHIYGLRGVVDDLERQLAEVRAEIERLKGELERVREKVLWPPNPQSWTVIRITELEKLERQLAEARAEVLKYKAAATVDTDELFETQKALSEARASTQQWVKTAGENQLKRNEFAETVEQARQEAARECLSLFYSAADESVSFAETYSKGIHSIKRKFKLEG